jgi:hypothetical protein
VARLAIIDRRGFAARIRVAIAENYKSTNAAAKAVGIPQSILSRLLNRKHAQIDEHTITSLTKLFPKGDDSWRRHVETEQTRAALIEWERWLVGECERIIGAERGFRSKHWEFGKLSSRLRSDLPSVHNEIEKCADQITNSRASLIRCRIFEPVLAARNSGWIERNASELTTEEFKTLVESGWKRERMLLNREEERVRAQKSELLADASLFGNAFSNSARVRVDKNAHELSDSPFIIEFRHRKASRTKTLIISPRKTLSRH